MSRLAFVVMMVLCRVASADPKVKCDPFSSMHRCDDVRVAQTGSAAPAAAMPMPPPPVVAKPSPAELRQTCVEAMNADPAFAQSIMENVDKRLEQRTLEAHQDAEHHIQKNERHVIYAYAAMWIVAALFVVFLWRRQQMLQAEIAGLRKDLEAAGKETTS